MFENIPSFEVQTPWSGFWKNPDPKPFNKLIRNYELTKPHALDVKYRNQMPLMRHLKHLDSLKQLNESQSLWFNVPKSNFEFYDLINDPYEINNLINDSFYENDIKFLQKALNSWVRKTKDKGEINEYDLIKSAYIQWLKL